MTYIEIIGPSGAGKTTLRNYLEANVEDINARVEYRNRAIVSADYFGFLFSLLPKRWKELVWNNIISQVMSQRIIKKDMKILSFQKKIINNSKSKNITKNVNRAISENILLGNSKLSGSYIIDDGIYQYMMRLIECNILTTDFYEAFQPPDVLITVTADPHTCLQRQENRKRGRATRFNNISENKAIKQLSNMNRATKSIQSKFTETETTIISINTNSDEVDNFQQARGRLMNAIN